METFSQCCRLLKGVNSIKISWVKGYASLKHIQEGITNNYLKAGNDKADPIAETGIQQGYDDGMHELAAFFSGQRKETKAVSIGLQKAILRV